MKKLIGKKVNHDLLGEGTIINAVESTTLGVVITVEFSNNIKRYPFPGALENNTLTCNNYDEMIAVAEDIAKEKEEARKKAEAEEKAKELQRKKEASDLMVKEAKEIIAKTDRHQMFAAETFRIFKVHQKQTFQTEYKDGYIWAPADGVHHHEILTQIQPGDIIFHYANCNVVAIGEAMSKCFDYPRPADYKGSGWGDKGYRVEVRYDLLTKPYSLVPHRKDIIANHATTYSSFDCSGDACQGYMYELEHTLAKLFADGILSTTQPAGVKRVLGRIK